MAIINGIYIHGLKGDYEKKRNEYENILAGTEIQEQRKTNAERMLARYTEIRNQAIADTTVRFDFNQLKAMQDDWIKALQQQLDIQQTNVAETAVLDSMALLMQKVQQWGNEHSQKYYGPEIIPEIEKIIDDIEKIYNSFSIEEKRNFKALIDKEEKNNIIDVNTKTGQISIGRMREHLRNLQIKEDKEGNKKPGYTFNQITATVNREAGFINEILALYSLSQCTNVLTNSLQKEFKANNISLKLSASDSVKQLYSQDIKVSSPSKSDAIISCNMGPNNLAFNFGISLKTSSQMFDEDGNFNPDKNDKTIKIQNIGASDDNPPPETNAWKMLATAIKDFSNPVQSAISNSLIYDMGNHGMPDTKSRYIIGRSILAAYFEKFLVGGGFLSKIGLNDAADALLVNGKLIPVTYIIEKVRDQLISNDFNMENELAIVAIDRKKNNEWLGEKDERNTELAQQRSSQAYETLKSTLKAYIKLRGTQLLGVINNLAWTNS